MPNPDPSRNLTQEVNEILMPIYSNPVGKIDPPTIFDNIRDTRVELDVIRHYASQCEDVNDFYHYMALVDTARAVLGRMINDIELQEYRDQYASNFDS